MYNIIKCRIIQGNANLTREAATTLAERGTAPVDNGKLCIYMLYIFLSL